MTHDEFEYKKNDDGEWEKVQVSKEEGKEAEDLLNEYRGLLLRIQRLREDLEETIHRKEKLDPVIEQIVDELQEEIEEARDQAEDEEEEDEIPEALNELRLSIKAYKRAHEE